MGMDLSGLGTGDEQDGLGIGLAGALEVEGWPSERERVQEPRPQVGWHIGSSRQSPWCYSVNNRESRLIIRVRG